MLKNNRYSPTPATHTAAHRPRPRFASQSRFPLYCALPWFVSPISFSYPDYNITPPQISICDYLGRRHKKGLANSIESARPFGARYSYSLLSEVFLTDLLMGFSSAYRYYFHYSDRRGYLTFCCHSVARFIYNLNMLSCYLYQR